MRGGAKEVFDAVKDHGLLWAATTTAAGGGRGVAGGRGGSRRRSSAASSREDASGQSDGVVVGHFEIPGDAAWLCNPGDGLAGDVAGFDIEHRKIPDFVHGAGDLAGGVDLKVENDGLWAAATTAASFGSRGRVLLGFECGRNIIGLPLAREFCLAISAGRCGQQGGDGKKNPESHRCAPSSELLFSNITD